MSPSPALMVLWFCTGIVSGLIDSIAGGGGLITIPVLLTTGISPHLALGTNKLQAVFGSGSATFHFARRGQIDFASCRAGLAWTFLGAAAGALTVSHIHPAIVGKLIPFLLAAILLYTVMKPRLGEQSAPPRMPARRFYLLAGLSLGFYDGFFGPGIGSLWAMAFVTLLGFHFVKATAYTKVMNFTSNVASLILFLSAGSVVFIPGFSMGLGQLAGAQLGARLVLRRGLGIIRPIYFAVVIMTVAKVVFDYWVR